MTSVAPPPSWYQSLACSCHVLLQRHQKEDGAQHASTAQPGLEERPGTHMHAHPTHTPKHTHTGFTCPYNLQAELTELVQTYKQEVTEAACELICDWAQKILKRSFDTVVEVARYLIQEHIVNPRCSQAQLVSSAALAGLEGRDK